MTDEKLLQRTVKKIAQDIEQAESISDLFNEDIVDEPYEIYDAEITAGLDGSIRGASVDLKHAVLTGSLCIKTRWGEQGAGVYGETNGYKYSEQIRYDKAEDLEYYLQEMQDARLGVSPVDRHKEMMGSYM
jgi:hypothetical protein